jgi:hypothetical protein
MLSEEIEKDDEDCKESYDKHIPAAPLAKQWTPFVILLFHYLLFDERPMMIKPSTTPISKPICKRLMKNPRNNPTAIAMINASWRRCSGVLFSSIIKILSFYSMQ